MVQHIQQHVKTYTTYKNILKCTQVNYKNRYENTEGIKILYRNHALKSDRYSLFLLGLQI